MPGRARCTLIHANAKQSSGETAKQVKEGTRFRRECCAWHAHGGMRQLRTTSTTKKAAVLLQCVCLELPVFLSDWALLDLICQPTATAATATNLRLEDCATDAGASTGGREPSSSGLPTTATLAESHPAVLIGLWLNAPPGGTARSLVQACDVCAHTNVSKIGTLQQPEGRRRERCGCRCLRAVVRALCPPMVRARMALAEGKRRRKDDKCKKN